MSPNAMSPVRIGTLLAVAVASAWGGGQYLDLNAFKRRNADAIAMCEGFTPGMAASEVRRRADAVSGAEVAFVDHNLAVRIPGQSLCFIEIADGRVRSASVARND